MTDFTIRNEDGESATGGSSWDAHPKMAPQPRKRPMKLLCLGLSRTGTMSTYVALQILGMNCYHQVENGRDNANGSMAKWRYAIEAKYYNGKGNALKTRADFEPLLWRYDAVTDIPCVLFSDELLQAYPEAKVVLTERDPDDWVKSIESVFHGILDVKPMRLLAYIDWEWSTHFMKLLRYSVDVWGNGKGYEHEALRKGFIKHNKHIKAVVAKERLLVWHPRDGWEPLCSFLGVKVPDAPMPRINDGQFTYDLFAKTYWKLRLRAAIGFWAKRLAPIGVAAVAFGLYRSGYLKSIEAMLKQKLS